MKSRHTLEASIWLRPWPAVPCFVRQQIVAGCNARQPTGIGQLSTAISG
jgi:hypothetical protein